MAKPFRFKITNAAVMSESGVLTVCGTRDLGDREFETITLTITGLKRQPGKPFDGLGETFTLTLEKAK